MRPSPFIVYNISRLHIAPIFFFFFFFARVNLNRWNIVESLRVSFGVVWKYWVVLKEARGWFSCLWGSNIALGVWGGARCVTDCCSLPSPSLNWSSPRRLVTNRLCRLAGSAVTPGNFLTYCLFVMLTRPHSSLLLFIRLVSNFFYLLKHQIFFKASEKKNPSKFVILDLSITLLNTCPFCVHNFHSFQINFLAYCVLRFCWRRFYFASKYKMFTTRNLKDKFSPTLVSQTVSTALSLFLRLFRLQTYLITYLAMRWLLVSV